MEQSLTEQSVELKTAQEEINQQEERLKQAQQELHQDQEKLAQLQKELDEQQYKVDEEKIELEQMTEAIKASSTRLALEDDMQSASGKYPSLLCCRSLAVYVIHLQW